MLLPKLKSAFSYEMGLLHLSVHSLQNLHAPSGPLPYIFKAPPPPPPPPNGTLTSTSFIHSDLMKSPVPWYPIRKFQVVLSL